MNSVQLVGRLTRDPEVRYTNNGHPAASFTVAVARPGQKTQDGKETSDFLNVVAWGKLAEAVGNSVAKGAKVFVSGRLQSRSYQAQDGSKRYVTEVVADVVYPSMESEPAGKRAEAASAFGGEEIPF